MTFFLLVCSLLLIVGLIKTALKSQDQRILYVKVFGLWIAVGSYFGNCFSPAIVIEFSRTIWNVRLTLRFHHKETTINFGPRIWWNSQHLAYRLGTRSDAPFGDYYVYKGLLGRHDYV